MFTNWRHNSAAPLDISIIIFAVHASGAMAAYIFNMLGKMVKFLFVSYVRKLKFDGAVHFLYWASITDIPCAPMSHTGLTGCSMSTVTLTSVPASEQEVS